MVGNVLISAQDGVVHESIFGNRPALPQSFQLQSPTEVSFYKHRPRRNAPDLRIDRRKGTINIKIVPRKVPTEMHTKPPDTARGGRVRSTTPAEDRYIVVSAKRDRRTTAQQVANQFLAASGKQISRKTVARRLRGGGLYARKPVVCPIDQTAPYCPFAMVP
ncbi:hypothetical protein TNCV_4235701 [Trichonephila clavipes]|nr:hypothetical protein TNCV_4235701 [Trichonephila clavipes]